MFFCFIGAPGIGKGTQAVLICKKMNLQHISTGKILRQAIQQKTSLGFKAEKYMNKGQLVPNDLIVNLVEEVLDKSGFVLDGFPRTLIQAQALDQLLKRKNIQLNQVFLFTLKERELIKRITGRRVAPVSGQVYHVDFNPPKRKDFCDLTGERLIQRDDDREESVRTRLKTYFKQQKSVTDFYAQKKIIQEVSAEGSPEQVYQRLLQLLP